MLRFGVGLLMCDAVFGQFSKLIETIEEFQKNINLYDLVVKKATSFHLVNFT